MFEKLNRARAERERNYAKLDELKKKALNSDAKVKELEATTVVDIVNERKLTPEQLYELLKEKEEGKVALDVTANKPLFGASLDDEEENEDEDY